MQKDESDYIPFWLDKKLAKKFNKKIQKHGEKNRSEVLRELIRTYVEDDQRNADPEKTEEFFKLVGELAALRETTRQIGGNLNQIARKLNETGKLYPGELYKNQNELREEFKELRKLLGRTLAARTK